MTEAKQLQEGAYMFVVAWIILLTGPTFLLSVVKFNKFRGHEFIVVRNPAAMKISLVVGAVSSFIVAPGGGYIFIHNELQQRGVVPIIVVILATVLNLTCVVVIFRMVDVFNKIKRARMFNLSLHKHSLDIRI